MPQPYTPFVNLRYYLRLPMTAHPVVVVALLFVQLVNQASTNDPRLCRFSSRVGILDGFALGFWQSVPISDVLFLDNVVLIKCRKYLAKEVENALRSRSGTELQLKL